MSSRFLSLKGLKECVDNQNPHQLKEFLENVCFFFDNDLSEPERDLALEVLFDDKSGTVGLLNRTIKNQKLFKDANAMVFDLWIKLLRNYGGIPSFHLYQDKIKDCCLEYINSLAVSAKEKENATVVLQEMFLQKIIQSNDVSALLRKVLNVLDLRSKQSRFIQQIYGLLGIISRRFPEIIVDHASQILDAFLRTLESTLLAQETIQFHMLTGSMEGLKDHLVNFAPSPEEDHATVKRIYVCIKKLSSPDERNKAPFRASLDVFISHCTLFSSLIYNDYEFWHKCLQKWMNSSISEDRRRGVFGTQAFHSVIATEIGSREESEGKKLLNFFLSYIRTILESPSSRPHETRVVIRGFGVLSAPGRRLLPNLVNDILSLVVQRSELISIVEDNVLRENLEHFPDYAQALSQIVLEIEDPRTVQILLQNIQNIVIKLIVDFHFLAKVHESLVVTSISESFYNLSKLRGISFENFIEKILLHGVIYTCSHKLVYDAALDWETDIDWKDNITYKFYLPLWKGILSEEGYYKFDKAMVSTLVFDRLVSVLFVILDKLNLRTRRRTYADEEGRDQEFFFCDPNIDLCPVRPRDFHIFFNLVDFYRDIFFCSACKENFRIWVNEYCTRIMLYAVKNPLVSGFLKLLEIGLVHANKLNYFTDNLLDEHHGLKSQLSYFLQAIISKTQRVSGELQAACVELVLKYPVQFFRDFLMDLVPVITVALEMGKSNVSITRMTMDCLEKISEFFEDSVNDLKMFYEKVLPCMDSFLQSRSINEDLGLEISQYKNRNKRRIVKTKAKVISETDLLKVQKRMVAFLGKIDPQNAALLLTDKENKDLVKWDVDQNIRLTLYLQDMKPVIYLDTIMPRICHLAITCSDRSTKIAACELLHAVVLFLIGTRNMNGEMWKQVFSRALLLGTEGDKTVQLMFEPLLMQIMHFVSKSDRINQNSILLDILMEGVSNVENCSVRDLSARCIRELVEWAIKHTTPEQLAASPVSVETILERLKVYSFDSDANKRIGAALAFNNLYRKLREEESLCDVFFIDLLNTFCVNYKLSEELSTAPTGTLNSDLEQVSMSLDHVVRVLNNRKYLFNKITERRIKPSSMTNGTLLDAVLFLLAECGSKLMNYRHKCIEMVEKLANCVTNCSSLSNFFQKFVSKEMFQEICEGKPDGRGIRAKPTLKHIKDLTGNSIYTWLEYFLSSLDCYCWLLSDYAILKPEVLFENCRIFEAITYFLNDFCWKNLYEILNDMETNASDTSDNVQFGVDVLHKINTIRCVVVVRIVDFIARVHNAGCAKSFPGNFWKENDEILIKFFKQITYEPRDLYFDFKSSEVTEKLPERISNVLKAIQMHGIEKPFLKKLQSAMIESLFSYFEKITSSIVEIFHCQRVTEHQTNIVRGISFACKDLKLFSMSESEDSRLSSLVKSLLIDLFNGIKKKVMDREYAVDLPPDVKKFANQLLKICFLVKDLSGVMVKFILVDTKLLADGTGEKYLCHGDHFFKMFKRTIFENINERFSEVFCNSIFSRISTNNFEYLISMFIEILEMLYKYRQQNHSLLSKFVETVLGNMTIIFDCFDDNSQDIFIVRLLSNLAMVSPFPLNVFKEKQPRLEEWILFRLENKNKNLEDKARIVFLLPLITAQEEEDNEKLSKSLENLQQNHFPLRSNEFPENSLQETGLKSIFKCLLQAMVASRSLIILNFMIKCTASDKKHILEWMIREETKNFIEKLETKYQKRVLESVFQMTNSHDLEPAIRCTILERFLLILVRNASEETNMQFYTDNIKRITEMIETNYGFGKSGWEVEHAIVDRIVGFSLIEAMTAILPKDKLMSPTCTISRAIMSEVKTGNELIGSLTKKSFYARTEIFVTDDASTAEFYRIYQCAAYRAVCCLVSNSQTDLRFFSKLIFEENSIKNEFIWTKIINCSDDMLYTSIGQEFDKYLKIKERFVSIRKLNTRLGQKESKFSTKQLRTQNIFESSLSQDVTVLDLNYSIVRNDADVLVRNETHQASNMASIKLEKHDLNKHEVMPTLCYVINHMLESGITPIASDPNVKRSYSWITSIADAMINPSNHKNIRLFLAQLIDNCRDVFQHYVHLVFRPVLEVLVDGCAGDRLNIFITDLTALLLSWCSKKLYTPSTAEETHLISSLGKFFIKNAWHDKDQIFKYNLEIIRTMYSVWKDVISVPSQLLLDLLMNSYRSQTRENHCGIILLGLILDNELIPWTPTTLSSFLDALYATLTVEDPSIYKPAAQVMGMVLNIISNDSDFDSVLSKICGLISNNLKKNERKSMDILYGIQKKFPRILQNYLETISYKIPAAAGAVKRRYLEMFLAALEAYDKDGIYAQIVSIGIKKLMKCIEFQLLALHIINRALPLMSESDVMDIYPHVEECCDSRKSECRDVVYEILIFIATKHAGTFGKIAGMLLLKGLLDIDSQIQNRIFQFWTTEANLPNETHEKFISLISDFSLNCEKQFLGLCTQLIVHPCVQSEDSKRQIFAFETERESKLTEYNIATDARSRSHSQRPLFAESQYVQRPSLLISSQMSNYIRQTNEEYFFEPTQDPNRFYETRQSFTISTTSLLPFGDHLEVLNRRSLHQERQPAVELEEKKDDSMDRLRKRFLRDTQKQDRDNALRIIDYKQRQRESQYDKLKAKQSKVQLYRRYRIGDYPDLLINTLAILLPLQGLMKRDMIIARQIFVSIFKAIVDELGPNSKQFIISIGDRIQTILSQSKTCEPLVFGAFLEMALLKPEQFDLSPEIVALISKGSNMLTIGAIYLENRLNADWQTDEILSVRTTSTVSIDEEHWLFLADIYNSMADSDVVAAIFADKMKTDPRLAQAIDLKANGKYEEARTLLIEVIKRDIYIEHYYAYICYYECFLEMGMWSDLSRAVQSQVDPLDELWEDDYNMNFLLPHLIQSELQTTLEKKSSSKDFIRVLESWMEDKDRSEYLKTKLCEEMMMLFIANQDFRQARVYSENYAKAFLIDWGVVSSLNRKLRHKNLMNVQRVAEIDNYSYFLDKGITERMADKLSKKWERCYIEKSDSLKAWNSLITYRAYIANIVSESIQTFGTQTNTSKLEDAIFNMNLQLFNASVHQKNQELSKSILRRLSVLGAKGNPEKGLLYKISEVKQSLLHSYKTPIENRIEKITPIWLTVRKLANDESMSKYAALQMQTLNMNAEIGEEIIEALNSVELNQDQTEVLFRMTEVSSASDMQQRVFDQCLWFFKKTLSIVDEAANSEMNVVSSEVIASNYCRLAQFCYDYHDHPNLQDSIETDRMFIETVFKGIKFDSTEARQLFPCLLQLDSIENGNLCDYFISCSSDAPDWAFLLWIPQILSHLNYENESYLDSLVRRIAISYPSALIYPFYVWRERYLTSSAGEKQSMRPALKEITEILRHPLVDKFIEVSTTLCLPEILLITHLDDFAKKCRNPKMKHEDFINNIEILLHNVFGKADGIQGSMFHKLDQYKPKIENWKQLTSYEGIFNDMRLMKESLNASAKRKGEIPLKSLCPWLADFQWCGQDELLELPGQYCGNKRPNINKHVNIVKFGQRVEILNSLRIPLRITIHGSNAKSYDFLVKYGEDLKQDQRIQQMLGLMSEKLRSDQNCANNNLFIRTFTVIPISKFSGMLSWVPDTVALFSFIQKCLRRRCPEDIGIMDKTVKMYLEFIQKPSAGEATNDKFIIYGNAVAKYTRENIVAHMRNLENAINPDIIKFALVDISVSPESFFVLRNNFATSIAAMSIAHWILGIGDRHPTNVLISTQTASLTGIDFGYTFGTAIRDLPVPELPPFRLTSHIVNALNPLGTSGTLFKCMAHSLRVYRASTKILVACMEVFVREPTAHWIKEPKDRIEVAKFKLLGFNPMTLIERELRHGIIATRPDFLEGYTKLLRGHPQFNSIRYSLPETNLTVEEQVKCLVDLATDPAILGIAYENYWSWL